MMGKIQRYFIVALLLCSMGAVNAQTWDIGFLNATDVTATLSGNTLTIRGTGKMKINSSLARDWPWYSTNNDIQTVIIEQGVTNVEGGAFYECSELTSVSIPNSVTEIGNIAFYGCSNLSIINIPISVTGIGRDAFKGTMWEDNQPNGVIYINNVLYKYKGTMPSNTVIDVREGTVSISPLAFYRCTALTSIIIPSGVTSIGEMAFDGCSGLAFINIPDGIQDIGFQLFMGCKQLTSIVIPESVTEIRASAFKDCTNLSSIMIPSSVRRINGGAFSGTQWFSSQPDGVVYINNILYSYKGSMPPNTTINVRESTVSISSSAFDSEKNLTAVTFPNSLEVIGETAFQLTDLSTVTFPESITSIGDFAFGSNKNLSSVIVLNPVPQDFISGYPFGCIGWFSERILPDTLCVPCGSLEAYQAAMVWQDFGTILELGPETSNIKAKFSCPAMVTVTYDLTTTEPTDLILYYSTDETNWLPAQTVTGDLSTQTSGKGKTITWDCVADGVLQGKLFYKVKASCD